MNVRCFIEEQNSFLLLLPSQTSAPFCSFILTPFYHQNCTKPFFHLTKLQPKRHKRINRQAIDEQARRWLSAESSISAFWPSHAKSNYLPPLFTPVSICRNQLVRSSCGVSLDRLKTCHSAGRSLALLIRQIKGKRQRVSQSSLAPGELRRWEIISVLPGFRSCFPVIFRDSEEER